MCADFLIGAPLRKKLQIGVLHCVKGHQYENV